MVEGGVGFIIASVYAPSGMHMCVGICCRTREGNPKIHPMECQVCVLGSLLKEISKGGVSHD